MYNSNNTIHNTYTQQINITMQMYNAKYILLNYAVGTFIWFDFVLLFFYYGRGSSILGSPHKCDITSINIIYRYIKKYYIIKLYS